MIEFTNDMQFELLQRVEKLEKTQREMEIIIEEMRRTVIRFMEDTGVSSNHYASKLRNIKRDLPQLMNSKRG